MSRINFSREYKDKIFEQWFNSGQPGYITFHRMVAVDEITNKIPGQQTLNDWITDEFRPRAEILNAQIKEQFEGMIVQEKVEMLRRHAHIGQEIADKALLYLQENDFTSSSSALRALVEGIRIEKESRGLPDALEKMSKTSDEDLVDQVKSLLEKGSISIEQDEEE